MRPGQIAFVFMQFSIKILPNNRFLLQTQGLAPPTLVLEVLDPPLVIHKYN